MGFDIEALTGMGIGQEAAERLVSMHQASVDEIKAELSRVQEDAKATKAGADQAGELQARIDAMKAGEDGYKAKYEAEKAALDALKAEQAEKKELEHKRGIYRALLIREGYKPKIADLISRCADVASYRLNNETGEYENLEAVRADIAAEWGEYKENAR